MATPPFTAALLRASADGFAGLAATRLLEREPALAASGGFEAWRAHLRGQILELAAAVDVELPERFGARVTWSRDAFAARGVSDAVLGSSLERLGEVLEEALPATAWSRLSVYLQRARRDLAQPVPPATSELQDTDADGRLAIEYITALSEGEEQRAIELVLQAVDAGRLSVPAALERVLAPAQRELGRRWHRGEASVAEEHFATNVSRRVFERLMARAPAAAKNGRTVVVAAVAGDGHSFGVQLVSAFFELDGWRSIGLGADLPVEDLVHSCVSLGADLVALGATLDTQREAAGRAITELRIARPDQRVIVGGAAFAGADELWRHVGADAFAPSATAAVEIGRRLVGG